MIPKQLIILVCSILPPVDPHWSLLHIARSKWYIVFVLLGIGWSILNKLFFIEDAECVLLKRFGQSVNLISWSVIVFYDFWHVHSFQLLVYLRVRIFECLIIAYCWTRLLNWIVMLKLNFLRVSIQLFGCRIILRAVHWLDVENSRLERNLYILFRSAQQFRAIWLILRSLV